MNKKTDPNTKHYFQIISHNDLAETLSVKLAPQKEIAITLWAKGEEEKDAEIYNLHNYDMKNKILHLHPTGKLVTNISGSIKTEKQILVKIPIDAKTNYFTGGILHFHLKDLSYSLEIQQEIFISQQRSNFRLNASNVIQIQFKINNNIYDAIDISTGGTSFIVDKFNEENFAKGQVYDECALRFDRKNYYIPKALISSIMPILDGNGEVTTRIKVGISFQNLNQKVVDELNVKIAVEARGEEMKKKFDAIFAKADS